VPMRARALQAPPAAARIQLVDFSRVGNCPVRYMLLSAHGMILNVSKYF
jgi:hypothetical protein